MQDASENVEWSLVDRFQNNVDAHLAKSYLESRGIDVQLTDEHMVSLNWLYSDALGGVKLLVPARQLEQAKALLAEVSAGQTEIKYE